MRVPRFIAPVLKDLFRKYPVVTINGPRQSGKTTLCRSVFPELPYVNLEAPDIRTYAQEDPRGFLGGYEAGAILDEIQRVPDLLSYIQPLVDEKGRNGLFVLTGSQHFGLSEAIGQSLAGRTALLRLLPLSLGELKALGPLPETDRLLHAGLYPRIHDQRLDPSQALGDYLETYVERDVRQLLEVRNLTEFQRFVRLCAGRTGQLLNLQSLGNDAGVSHTTARSWLGVLEASFIVFLLPPFFANVSKRLIKTPKLYFHDVGLAAYLMGIESWSQVRTHPLKGALFETLVASEVVKHRYNQGKRSNLSFYRERAGAEIDFLYEVGGGFVALEAKAGETLNQGFFGGFPKLRKTLGDRVLAELLIYGGPMSGKRDGVRFTPVEGLGDTLAGLDRELS